MKINIRFNWIWLLKKARILFIIGVFYCLYRYTMPVFAFMWIGYFILNDLSEIIDEQENTKEERDQAWKNISFKRKGF